MTEKEALFARNNIIFTCIINYFTYVFIFIIILYFLLTFNFYPQLLASTGVSIIYILHRPYILLELIEFNL